MSSEYLTRMEFNKRVILGGMVAASSAADLANTDAKLVRLQNEAKNEVMERGINPPTNIDEIQKPKESKVQAQSALRADSQRGSSGSFSTAPYQG